MKVQSSTKRLLGTASALALSAAAFIASSGTPASAQATKGIYLGGSTLASEAFRQIFDCYTGATVGNDGFTFNAGFDHTKPTPGWLPTSCTVVSTVQGMYAGVGSGNGMRGFISNSPVEWYRGTVTPVTTIAPPLPESQPPYVDSLNANFGAYPYPRVDIGMSDSPLPATLAALTTSSVSFTPTNNWTATSAVTANGSSTVTYSTAAYGQPIQIPAFEVNVAIPVNTSSLTVNSAIPASTTTQGAAIQLTTAQMCAIFSGLVSDWNDTTTVIPYLDSAGAQQTTTFHAANVGNGIGIPAAYSGLSKTIKVVYRGDGSGTSFIVTNYLKAVCPLLDPNDTYKYQSIFNTANLPNTSFNNLVTNINTSRTNGSTITGQWVPATGSGGVASSISTDAANGGRIGYVSADFTQPYTTQVASGTTTVTAPLSAALQNENLRGAGIYVPNTVSTSALTFVAPTPDGANNAWNDINLRTPSTTWTWADYDIYKNVFTPTTTGAPVTQNGVNVAGLSVLPLTSMANAYPLSGTAFMYAYSCYSVQGDANRVANLRNFLNWYVKGADSSDPAYDAKVSQVIQNNGFHHIPVNYKKNIVAQYLRSLSNSYISEAPATGTGTKGCANVTGGAN